MKQGLRKIIFIHLLILSHLSSFGICEETMSKTYHQNGSLASEVKMRNGQPEGLWRMYHENGNLAVEQLIENGEIVGQVKTYHENGILSGIMPYEYNQPQGEGLYYNRKGEIMRRTMYDHGTEVSNEVYDVEGTRSMEFVFVKWVPGEEELTVEKFSVGEFEMTVTDSEMALLREVGIKGKLKVVGSGGLGNELEESRVVFIFQKHYLNEAVSLDLPDKTNLIYIQEDNGQWRKVPEEAPVLTRKIEFKNYLEFPGTLRYMAEYGEELKGASSGGSVTLK